MEWGFASPIFISTDNPWPGMSLDSMHGDVAVGGPTGVPWVNSNGWFAMLARVLARGKSLWLDYDPPDSTFVSHPGSYRLAVADSCAYGARWMISLDAQFLGGIRKGIPAAMDTWRSLCEAVVFYENHRQWNKFESLGTLLVASSFGGDDAFMSGEILNLLSRRQVQYRISGTTGWHAAPSSITKAVLWADKTTPSPEQLANLLSFVRRGGVVIAPEYWGPAGAKAARKDPSLQYNVYNIDLGQIAVADAGFEDPFQVALDTHMLISRRNDLMRLYNDDSVICHMSSDPGLKQSRLVQVLNYSGNSAKFVTVWVRGNASGARLFLPGAPISQAIQSSTANRGTDLHVPEVAVCGAVEFEGRD